MKHFPATKLALNLVERGHLISDAANSAGVDVRTLRKALRAAGHEPKPAISGKILRAARETGLMPVPAAASPDARTRRSAEVAHGLQLVTVCGKNVSEAARLAGCSREALSRAISAGRTGTK